MTGLVICRPALFRGGKNGIGLPFKTAYDAVYRIQEILLQDFLVVPSGGGEGGLVADIRNVSSGESRCVLGHEFNVEVF